MPDVDRELQSDRVCGCERHVQLDRGLQRKPLPVHLAGRRREWGAERLRLDGRLLQRDPADLPRLGHHGVDVPSDVSVIRRQV